MTIDDLSSGGSLSSVLAAGKRKRSINDVPITAFAEAAILSSILVPDYCSKKQDVAVIKNAWANFIESMESVYELQINPDIDDRFRETQILHRRYSNDAEIMINMSRETRLFLIFNCHAADIYQSSNHTTGQTDCTDMQLRIKLPDATIARLQPRANQDSDLKLSEICTLTLPGDIALPEAFVISMTHQDIIYLTVEWQAPCDTWGNVKERIGQQISQMTD